MRSNLLTDKNQTLYLKETVMSIITGKEFALKDIFCSKFEFFIPTYQRPYAWQEKHIIKLFENLYDAWKNKEETYFLGSIVLIKKEKEPKSDIVDGQQRLTSLIILLATLASQLEEEDKIDIKNTYLIEKGKKFEKIKSNPRFHLREKEKLFFEKYIQNINIKELLNLDENLLNTESKYHIKNNTKILFDFFTNKDTQYFLNKNELSDFSSYIISNCYLIVVYTPDQQSAFKIFNILNNSGLSLSTTDIIKSEIIGNIPKDEQDKYTEKWENIEINTTRDGFNELFSHIRTIYTKAKAKKELIEEFNENITSKFDSKYIIDNIIEPYSIPFIYFTKQNFQSSEKAEEINNLLRWLNKINNSDWMPVAIKFFTEYKNDANYLYDFLFKLERLAAILMITGKDVNYRIKRFSEILSEMELKTNHNINSPLVSLSLTEQEKEDFINLLNSDIYHLTSYKRNHLILKLDSFVSSVHRNYDDKILTIEHILPQTINENSEWSELWSDEEEQNNWTHKLANLVPLPKRHNSSASNKTFYEKKTIYKDTKGKCADYALTIQALNENEWTPEIVKNRQIKLINIISENWKI